MTKNTLAYRLRRLYSENKLAINFVIRVLIIYISWKILLWFLGEERVPIDERYWPWLSSVWESFNDLVRLMLIYSSKFYFDLAGYTT